MEILQSDEIAPCLTEVSPHHIAVAYIGCDWEEFIKHEGLEEIILSPTIGSNPDAIEQIAEKISWDRVLFLDNLHAKIYIGKDSAIIGSSNLSRNGLGVSEGLEECAVNITEDKEIGKITAYYGKLRELAHKAYPTYEKKLQRLSKLKTQCIKLSVYQ